MAESAASVRAWLLDVGLDHSVAIGEHELIEVLPTVTLENAHEHISWRDREIPIVNLAALAGQEATHAGAAVVAAYQVEPGAALRHGALCLERLPASIRVDDGMACDVPAAPHWQSLAIACFQHEGEPVPVIDVARVFENL